ncbi:MAG: SPOR domain-containing protein [Flavobacteriaceae bacterium]|nr:SPOR domain-containing protein [Flavobacteriaceae bacterium]
MSKQHIRLSFFSILITFTTYISCHAQEGSVTVNQDHEIKQLLALKKDLNTSKLNYKIQIFNGSHSGALKAKSDFEKLFTEWDIDLQYETPNYKIWIGDFRTRLEADRALVKVKKEIPNAFIFKPKRDNKKQFNSL